MNAREAGDGVAGGFDDALPTGERWLNDKVEPVSVLYTRAFNTLVFIICGWSLLETPLEMGVFDSYARLIALLLSKALVVGTGIAAVAKIRVARVTFSLICSVSVLAVAPGLQMEFRQSFEIAIFSSIECLSKAACVITFCVVSLCEGQSRRQSHLR